MTWKIVGVSKVSVLYIYILITIETALSMATINALDDRH